MHRNCEEVIANFRYQLIAPIVTKNKLSRGEIKFHLTEAAKKEYQIPYSNQTKVSLRTLERYLHSYREGGWEALKPQKRKYSTRIPQELIDQAILLKKENPRRSITQIINILEMAKQSPKGLLKRSTLYDYFKKHNLNEKYTMNKHKSFQRFESKTRNGRWQGDFSQMLYLQDPQNPKKKKKVHLFCWLDEYSRVITHGQCYFDEKLPRLEDSLKKAIIKFGKPERLYVDNASTFSSHHLKRVCGKLGIAISHTKPYSPQGRGKVERLFGFIKASFLPEILLLQKKHTLSLADVNSYFETWVDRYYHVRLHSSTKQPPLRRFEEELTPLKHLEYEELYDAFLCEEMRKANKAGVISLHGILYQVDLDLAGAKVLVRYDPFDPRLLQVFYNNQQKNDATVLCIPENIDFAAKQKTNTTENEDINTHLNYLTLLQEKNQHEGLRYSWLQKEQD